MASDEMVEEMRAFVPSILAAVEAGNLEQMHEIYGMVTRQYSVQGGHALLVLLADQLMRERARHREVLSRVNGEATKYAAAYLDQKRRVTELRELMVERAAAVKAGTVRRRAA